MRNYTIISIALLIIGFSVSAQRDLKVVNEDFDGDGIPEELVINSYLGEIEYAVLNYDAGVNTCTLNLKPPTKPPSLLNVVPICEDLLAPQYCTLLSKVDSILFDEVSVQKPDPSMEWLFDVASTKETVNDHPFFSSWAQFKPKISYAYYQNPVPKRILKSGFLPQRIASWQNKADSLQKYWVVFDANKLEQAKQLSKFDLNPEWPQIIDTLNGERVYKTGHSVFLEKDTSHQVIFVADGLIFQNMQKKEWEAIQQVQKYNDYFLVLTFPYPAVENKLFLVDPKKGFVFELKKEVVLDIENFFLNIESFEVMENELFLFIRESPQFPEIKEKSVSLVEITQSIDLLTKKK